MKLVKKCGLLLGLVALVASSSAAYGYDTWKPQVVLGPGIGSGSTFHDRNTDRYLSSDTCYVLTGTYWVLGGAKIMIEPGTYIFGDSAAALMVTRDGQIFAEGTKQDPIVFTSRQVLLDEAPDRGDWGGVVLLGYGTNNQGESEIEGGLFGWRGTYGAPAGQQNPHHNAGVFRYCRIEFPGFRYQLNNEINGLTMGGVGDSTEIHHIQVSYSFDDSYEWFGGTVNCSCLVALGGTDDEFDTDFGYTGNLQFCFGMRDSAYWDAQGESNGFESDNNSGGVCSLPITKPIFSNVTLIGPTRHDGIVDNLPPNHTFQYSAVLRRCTSLCVYNSVIMGYPWGLSIRDASTQSNATTDALQVRNLSVQADSIPPSPTDPNCIHHTQRWASVCDWFCQSPPATPPPPLWNNWNCPSDTSLPSRINLVDVTDITDPDPRPAPGSELIGTADFTWPNLDPNFFTTTTYRGAFDPTLPMNQQWTAGWTNFNPKGAHYLSVEDIAVVDTRVMDNLLGQNYPNPFNPVTTIQFSVPVKSQVTLKVYNVQGQEVATLVDAIMGKGTYEKTFSTDELPSGTYFYRLTGDGFTETRKMILLR